MNTNRGTEYERDDEILQEFVRSFDPEGHLRFEGTEGLVEFADAAIGEGPTYTAAYTRSKVNELVGERTDLRGYTFYNIRGELPDLPDEFSGKNLDDCQFFGIEVDFNLRGTSLRRANFYGAPITADISEADFTKARLPGQDFSSLQPVIATRFSGAEMILNNFRGLTLRGVSFRGANLTASEFSLCVIEDYEQKQSDFSVATLYLASAVGAKFHNVIMTGVNMPQSKLVGAEFYDCDLRFADFYYAIMADVTVRGSCMRYCNLREVDGYQDDKAVKFEDVDLSGSILSTTDFTNGIFIRCNFSGCNAYRANLFYCQFVDCNLRGCDLSRANIRGACFRGSDMRGVIITERTRGWIEEGKHPAADFTGAANIDRIDFSKASAEFKAAFLKRHKVEALPEARAPASDYSIADLQREQEPNTQKRRRRQRAQ